MHVFNKVINKMNEEFRLQHKNTIPYHPQENGNTESFNNIWEHVVTNICNVNYNDYDHKKHVVLKDYRATCKKIIGYNPFRLVYKYEVVMPMEYIVPSLRIIMITVMEDVVAIEEIFS